MEKILSLSNKNNTTRKRLLIFSDWFFPAYKAGGPVRSVLHLTQVLQPQLDIWVFTSNKDYQSPQPLEDTLSDEWVEFSDTTKVFYSSSQNQSIRFIKKVIGEINPHFIYLNSMFSPKFSLFPLLALPQRKTLPEKIVLAPRGMLHVGALQYKRKKKQWYLFLTTQLGLFKRVTFHATDQQEKQDISKHFGSKNNTVVIPNIPKSEQNPLFSISKNPGHLKCTFISRIHPKKNLLFFLQLLSRVPPQFSLDFSIAGNIEDEAYWQKCQQQISNLSSNITVNYVGSLSHDQIDRQLSQAHIFVLPTFGENFGHAIFESFIAGRPVLISDLTPWKNLSEKKIGWDIPLNNEALFYNSLIEALEMDQSTYDLWAASAWNFAHDYIKESEIPQKYLQLFS